MNALLQILVPAFLFAAPAADAPDQERGKKANKMQRHDADGSGTLSATEVAGTKMERRFSTIDADGDGELTRDEMRAHHKAHRGTEGKKGKDRDHRARKGDKKARKGKKGERGDKAARKSSKRDGKQASKATRTGGKKAFAKRGKGRTDRKRFAQRGPKSAA